MPDELMIEEQRADGAARISVRTHREMRYIAALSAIHGTNGRPVSMRELIDLAWEALKAQRPEIVEQIHIATSAHQAAHTEDMR